MILNYRFSNWLVLYQLLTILEQPWAVECANWGQVSGTIKQNLAIPYQPSLSKSHWSPRWGFSIINANVKETGDGDAGRIYLMGGDSWIDNIDKLAQNTGTQYMNDIWFTSGSGWKVVKDDMTRQARTYSDMSWNFVSSSSLLPPPNTDYDSWLACQIPIYKRFEKLQSVGKTHLRYPSECSEDNLMKPTQWSPRRNFATVNFKTLDYATNDIKEFVFLIGGRSRRLHDIERDRAVGGLQADQIGGLRGVKAPHDVFRFSSSYSSANNWRETSLLTNDVWRWDVSNSSESSIWELMTPGCDSSSSQMEVLVEFGLRRRVPNKFSSETDAKFTTGSSGTSKCDDYLDCYGSEACLYPSLSENLTFSSSSSHLSFDTDEEKKEFKKQFGKSCICQMFQPRESHAAYATSKSIIVLGGLVSFRPSRCGDHECGDSDGSSHAVFMNDVWKSAVSISRQTTSCDNGIDEDDDQVDDDDSSGDCSPPSSFYSNKVTIGETWQRITSHAPWSGRAGHSVLYDYQSNIVWLMGGYRLVKLGDAEAKRKGAVFEREYLNDVWYCLDPDNPREWIQFNPHLIPWSPRAFFSITMEPNSTMTAGRRLVHLFGGEGKPLQKRHQAGSKEIITESFLPPSTDVVNELPTVTHDSASSISKELNNVYVDFDYLGDAWSWDLPRNPSNINEEDIAPWRLDFSPHEHYRRGAGDHFYFGDGYLDGIPLPNSQVFNLSAPSVAMEATGPPYMYYIGPDDDITTMRQFWLPVDPTKKFTGTRSEIRPYMTKDREEMLRSLDINTIRDLAEADKYKILKLRGEDFPQVKTEDRMTFTDICDFYRLATDIIEKCTYDSKSTIEVGFANGEARYPRNAKVVFLRGPPSTETMPAYHGRDYTGESEKLAISGDLEFQVDNWDGCGAPVAGWSPATLINVNGLGFVGIVEKIRNPVIEIQELHCRITPGARAYHKSTFFQQRMYVFGGKSEDEFAQDSWYRDDRFPTTSFVQLPETNTDDALFRSSCDEDGCLFEYKIWDPSTLEDVTSWTRVRRRFTIDWMDSRRGGPGTGDYVIYVRAIDPAGNYDDVFELDRNVYKWRYVDPIPWDIIGGAFGGIAGLGLVGYLEYKRRARKAALERYAMKRMRRKFKAARNKDALAADTAGKTVDWRTIYTELGDGEEDEALVASGSRKKKKRKDDDDEDIDEGVAETKGGDADDEAEKKKMKMEKEKKKQDRQKGKLDSASEWKQRRQRIEKQKEKDKNRTEDFQSEADHYARDANDKDPKVRRIKANKVVPVGEVATADKRSNKQNKVAPEPSQPASGDANKKKTA